MKCEKCQDVGFIEHNAGLLTEFCDCEIGREVLAKKRAIYGIPEEEQIESGDDLNELDNGNDLRSPNGDNLDNQSTGSPNTSEPKQPSKPKKKKKARKRAK